MKKIFILFLLVLSINVYSQWPKYRFTSGYIDKNPVFALKYNTSNNSFFSWEFLAFERWTGTNSQICVLKIGPNGPADTVRHITNTLTQKRNPSISYISIGGPVIRIPCALTIWEEFTAGKWNLFASSYDTITGWSAPYPFDTTAGIKSGVKVYGNAIPNFMITYQKNNDIIFRQFNSQTRQVTYDTNLTATDTGVCSNPHLSAGTYTYLAYERVKSDGKKAIYFRYKTGTTTWNTPDTAAYLGNNIINEIAASNFLYPEVVFQSDRTGKFKLYSTQIYPYTQLSQAILNFNQNNYYNHTTLRTFLYPIITDYPTWQVFAYLRKSDSIKLMCGGINLSVFDSTTIGDTSLVIKHSINRGIVTPPHSVTVWIAYTKDSLSFSNIYAKRTYIFLNGINKISGSIPERFELYQNYPNPFNPNTKIRYTIICNSFVKLQLFDILGKEIAILVNERRGPGTYEIPFSVYDIQNGRLPSGIYFYKIETTGEKNYTEVKKMVLLK